MSALPETTTLRRPRRIAIPVGVGWGIALAVGAALISGVAIYLNAFAVKQLPDAGGLHDAQERGRGDRPPRRAPSALGAAREVRTLDRRSWDGIVLVGVIGGSIPFILFFSGLALASAPSAAFIQKTLFVWVALLAVPILGERLGVAPLVGPRSSCSSARRSSCRRRASPGARARR